MYGIIQKFRSFDLSFDIHLALLDRRYYSELYHGIYMEEQVEFHYILPFIQEWLVFGKVDFMS